MVTVEPASMSREEVRRRRVLIVTSLFPSNLSPGHAPFNRRQFVALAKMADVEVVSVVPRRLGDSMVRGLLKTETIESLPVVHKRYLSVRGLPSLNAVLMVAGLLPGLARQVRERRYEVLLGSYAYPEGCAVVLLGRILKLPVVVKCHGSDLDRVTQHHLVRRQLQWLLPQARAVVTVSEHLAARARELGVRGDRVHVVYNGIDRQRFRPMSQSEARRRLSLPLDRDVVLFMGHLEEHKGVYDLIRAAAILQHQRPRATVVFVGAGPLRQAVQGAAADDARGRTAIRLSDPVPHDEVPFWMAAADVVCLPSWNEGMPNVIREAHACGRPVVATRVGGIPEAVHSAALGILVPPRQPEALAEALAQQLERPPVDPEALARLGSIPTWEQSAKNVYDVLDRAIRDR